MTVEYVIASPLLVLCVFLLLQLALWGIALVGARAAAISAARDAAAYGATTSDGRTSANAQLDHLTGNLLHHPTVTVTETTTTVTVTITGRSDLLPFPVSWTATAPKERFVTDADGFTSSGLSRNGG